MPSGKPDFEWLTNQTIRIIIAATDNDGQAAVDALAEVEERYGERGLFSTYCALAEAIVRMGDHRKDGDGFYGFEVQHLDRGPMSPDDVDPDARDVMQAMRFVTAWLNDDSEQKNALFDAAETPEQAAQLPAGLLKLVSAYGRHKLEEAGASDA